MIEWKKSPVEWKWKGNHHSYYGIFFIAFGLFNWYMGEGNGYLDVLLPFWQSFVMVGGYFIFDDIVEHKITADTPLRLIFNKIFRRRD